MIQRIYEIYEEQGLTFVLLKIYQKLSTIISRLWIIDGFWYGLSRESLRNHMEKEESIYDAMDTTFNYQGYGRYQTIRPIHSIPNTIGLLEYLNERGPRVILEIGTGYGGSFYLWNRAIPSSELVISVDIAPLTPRKFLKLIESDADSVLVEGDSHEQSTFDQINQILDERQIDVLYIDGDHSYEGVIQDWEMYSDLVADGGVVIFDDIDNPNSPVEVPQAWETIKEGRQTKIIKRGNKSSAQGIVIIPDN